MVMSVFALQGLKVNVTVIALDVNHLIPESGSLGSHTTLHFLAVIMLEGLDVNRQHIGTVLHFERLGVGDRLDGLSFVPPLSATSNAKRESE